VVSDRPADRDGTHGLSGRGKRILITFVLAAMLVCGLEWGARLLVGTGFNPELSRLVRDYDRLRERGADWIRFVPDRELGYAPRPYFELPAARGPGRTVHNGDGYRNYNDFGPKAPKTLRVACFGASTTYGVGVESNSETYPAQLELALDAAARRAGWDRVEVLNLGVGGYNSREIRGTMERMLPRLQPDAVVIQNAINDVIPRFYPDFSPDYSHFRTPFTPLELSAWQRLIYRSRAWMIVAHGLGRVKPLSLQSQTQRPMPPVDEALANLEYNPPDAFADNVRAALNLAEEAGARVWLVTQAYLDVPAFAAPDEASRRLEGGYRRGLDQHTKIVIAIAEASGAGLVPLHETMPRQQAYFTDPIHMSAAGNRVKAALIADAMGGALPPCPE